MTNNQVKAEIKGCFDFFWNEANTDKSSDGFGLVRDKTAKGAENIASIASVGFGLSSIISGVERGFITKQEGQERVSGTLKTFMTNVEQAHGFFFHFLDMKTGKKYQQSYDCASIIDTSIFLNGALTTAEYFGGEIKELFEEIYSKVDWQKYYNKDENVYYMGYKPESGGFGAWDMYAEQLMQYILGVASPTFAVSPEVYNGFARDLGEYAGQLYYNSPGGALFCHQFSHGYYDFKGVTDADGINWFDNSVKATIAAREFSINNEKRFKTFHKNAWGVTACEGSDGYRAYGVPPFHPNCNDINDGTIPPCGALGSIIFTPEIVLEALEFYNTVPNLIGKYGLKDSYNQDKDWICDFVIGIDKGITAVMLENFETGLIHELYMQNKYVKEATTKLSWKKN